MERRYAFELLSSVSVSDRERCCSYNSVNLYYNLKITRYRNTRHRLSPVGWDSDASGFLKHCPVGMDSSWWVSKAHRKIKASQNWTGDVWNVRTINHPKPEARNSMWQRLVSSCFKKLRKLRPKMPKTPSLKAATTGSLIANWATYNSMQGSNQANENGKSENRRLK